MRRGEGGRGPTMTGSQQEDYLLRQAAAAAAMLARIIGLRSGGKDAEARVQLEEAYSLVLGPQAGLLRRVDSGTAATILGSAQSILAFARLLHEEAAQEPDAHRSAGLKVRAVELGIEAARCAMDSGPALQFLEGLVPGIDPRLLTDGQRAFLEESLEWRT